jgi:hypothetical protein
MIDREARDNLAELLRHLVSGQITNDQFEASIPVRTKDEGCLLIIDQAWLLYSDFYHHKLTGRHAIKSDTRRDIARWIDFLHSDLEYRWPRHPCSGFLRLIAMIMSFGKIPEHYDRKWEASGDFDIWPFKGRQEYEEARRKPRLLGGR